jgi:hypothetical protein
MALTTLPCATALACDYSRRQLWNAAIVIFMPNFCTRQLSMRQVWKLHEVSIIIRVDVAVNFLKDILVLYSRVVVEFPTGESESESLTDESYSQGVVPGAAT